jgi:alpha-methylacyl-CoA racemase
MGGPLAGLRVIELAGIGPAPFCGMLLADLGADVVRVDRKGGVGPLAINPQFDLLNRGKRSIEVDLKHEQGADLVLELVERADVLLEGYRPGVTERLGIGPDACLARNPRLVYGRMTGWGQTGPLARTAGHDINYLAISGALHVIGRAGEPPQVPANLLGDFGGGSLYLAVGVLAALREVERSGQGQVVDAAIVDGAAHLSTMLHGLLAAGSWRDRRGVNLLDTGAPFYDVYRSADDHYLAVGPLEQRFFATFVQLLGVEDPDQPPLQGDVASWPALRQRFASAFAQRTRDEWVKVFEGSDACVAPVLSLTEAPQHPHLAERKTFAEHHGIVQPTPAPRFSGTPAELGRPPAVSGADSRAILIDWGVDRPDDLLATGVIRQVTPPEANPPEADQTSPQR